MLNRALQTQDIEVIVKMGSFIQDLHQQLEQLQINNENLNILYRCQNALFDDNDQQITHLNQLIQEEIKDSNGWYKLAKLTSNIRDFDHAKEIYFVLLDLLTENDLLKMSYIYNELGLISDELGEYLLALEY